MIPKKHLPLGAAAALFLAAIANAGERHVGNGGIRISLGLVTMQARAIFILSELDHVFGEGDPRGSDRAIFRAIECSKETGSCSVEVTLRSESADEHAVVCEVPGFSAVTEIGEILEIEETGKREFAMDPRFLSIVAECIELATTWSGVTR